MTIADSDWKSVDYGLAGPSYLKRKVVNEELILECWEHPRWSPALALLKQGDAEPISKLFRAEEHVPGEIAKELAIMLNPPPHYKGSRLNVQLNNKWTIRRIAERLREHRQARQELEVALAKFGKMEAALAHVGEARKVRKLPFSKRYLQSCWSLTDLEITEKLQKVLGYME